MPHMLAQEHMGITNAFEFGSTRDYATVAAALAAIGSANRILLLPFSGDGVWTINTNLALPANVTLWLAPGVTVNGSGNITTTGGKLVAFDSEAWYTGTGANVFTYGRTYFGAIVTQYMGINAAPQVSLHVRDFNVSGAHIRAEESVANRGAVLEWYSGATARGNIGLAGDQDIRLTLQNSARFITTGGNVGIGMVPTTQLELSTGGAQKSTGTTWSNPSDPRLKQDVEPYTDGLELLKQVEPVWYVLNGRGGIESDGERHVGYLADELQPIAPYMVGSYRGKLDPNDRRETDILTFKGGDALIAALINAVQELSTRVEALEAHTQPPAPQAAAKKKRSHSSSS